jgi:hypothetical protein
MSLKDVLTKQAPRRNKSWLDVCEEKLDLEDYQYLLEVLRNEEEFSAPYIATIMTRQGFPVSSTTVLSARRKVIG